MILGVIVLRVSTIPQKAFTVGSKSYWCGEYWGEHRFINAFCSSREGPDIPQGAETNGNETGPGGLFHQFGTVVALILSQLFATDNH